MLLGRRVWPCILMADAIFSAAGTFETLEKAIKALATAARDGRTHSFNADDVLVAPSLCCFQPRVNQVIVRPRRFQSVR